MGLAHLAKHRATFTRSACIFRCRRTANAVLPAPLCCARGGPGARSARSSWSERLVYGKSLRAEAPDYGKLEEALVRLDAGASAHDVAAPMSSDAYVQPTDVGLCLSCTHLQIVPSTHGSVFYLCKLSFVDSNFRRYPRLPVLACQGHRPKLDQHHDG